VDFSTITIAFLCKATDRPPVTDKHYHKKSCMEYRYLRMEIELTPFDSHIFWLHW